MILTGFKGKKLGEKEGIGLWGMYSIYINMYVRNIAKNVITNNCFSCYKGSRAGENVGLFSI